MVYFAQLKQHLWQFHGHKNSKFSIWYAKIGLCVITCFKLIIIVYDLSKIYHDSTKTNKKFNMIALLYSKFRLWLFLEIKTITQKEDLLFLNLSFLSEYRLSPPHEPKMLSWYKYQSPVEYLIWTVNSITGLPEHLSCTKA